MSTFRLRLVEQSIKFGENICALTVRVEVSPKPHTNPNLHGGHARNDQSPFKPALPVYRMGFTTNLFSGFTLTSTTLYLSLLYHQPARAHQAALLHQQTLLLNSLSDPDLASELATMADANYSGGLREGIRPARRAPAPWPARWPV